MTQIDIVLNSASSAAASVVLLRAGCVLNRMHVKHGHLLLQLAYLALGLFSFTLMLVPLYREEAAALGYPGFVISAAAVLVFDRRLRTRVSHGA